MILQPFTISSRGRTFQFVQREALDSEILKDQITELVVANHAFSQHEAMCAQLGLQETGSIPNLRFGVFEGTELVGIFGIGCVQYVSGPWLDTVEWVVTDPGAPALFKGRPMPGFLDFSGPEEDDLSTAAVIHILGLNTPHLTAQGTALGFSELEWAFLPGLGGEIGLRAKRMHDAAVAHPLIAITETVDPTDARRVLVTAELA